MNAETAPPPPAVPPPVPKKGMSKGCIIGLVIFIVAVIGGIALLAVLGIFGGNIVVRKAKELQSKAVMKGLEIAIVGYQTEYLHLPHAGVAGPTQDNSAYDSSQPDGMALLDVLLSKDTISNPRQIRFWEHPTSKPGGAGYTAEHGLKDPWGTKGYRMILDYDGNGLIADPETGADVKASVLLYSAGADGDFSTWKDNVRSWQ